MPRALPHPVPAPANHAVRLGLKLGGMLVVFAGLLVPGAFAQSCVWKVTKGNATIYLGGTCHVLRAQDLPLPREFDLAFSRAQALYFETDVARLSTPETQQLLLGEASLPPGQSLDQVLSAPAWQAVQKYAEKNGLPAEQLARFKPWMVVLTVAGLELQKIGVSEEGVDVHYFNQAAAAGKSTHALEPFERQLKYVTHLGAGHESEMVLSSFDELDRLPAEMSGILRAWRAGDLPAIDATMLAETREKFPAMYDELIRQRNQAWLPEIEALLQTPEVELVLVGAAHLAGPDGLLAALRKHGCQVEQLRTK